MTDGASDTDGYRNHLPEGGTVTGDDLLVT